MEDFFKEWSYASKNPMSEWSDGTNQYKLRKLIETLDENRLVNDVFKSARVFFDRSCENLTKSWTHANENERSEREKSYARVFGHVVDMIKSGQVKTNENIETFMELFTSIGKQHKHIVIKLMCLIRLISLLNNGDFVSKLDEAKMSQIFSTFEINLSPSEYYFGQVVGPWGSEIERFLAKIQGDLFIKHISAIQKYFEYIISFFFYLFFKSHLIDSKNKIKISSNQLKRKPHTQSNDPRTNRDGTKLDPN